jgi:hypothetical protein
MALQSSARWVPLHHYLKLPHRGRAELPLTFRQIEGILSDGLPRPARRDPAWWVNDAANEQARAWLDAGWRVHSVDLAAEQVVFTREQGA